MKERPILFSGPMVRAIIEGRKTMTRRICKHQPPDGAERIALDMWDNGVVIPNPYGWEGDRLWVRETWGKIEHPGPAGCPPEFEIVYRSDFTAFEASPLQFGPNKWRPSIFMPRTASRILLEITGVRVERLQAITEEDAVAEGVEFIQDVEGWKNYFPAHLKDEYFDTPRKSFFSLFGKINGWDLVTSNPWVWVIEFKKIYSFHCENE